MSRKQIFLNNSEKIWGDLFDYSNVDYVDSKTNVTIICKKHGGFHRTPNDHTHKNKPTGCPDCGKESRSEKRRTSIQKFIKKSIKKFGAIYDYSDVTLIKNVDTSVIIDCPVHGKILMTPYAHYKSKTGCNKCGQLLRGRSRRVPKKEFIERSKNKHGKDKYDYSELDYKGVTKKVNIICLKHNKKWRITGRSHLNGVECCEDCSGRYRLTLDNFIERSKNQHGDKYDYSKVIISTVNSYVTIICPDHIPQREWPQIAQSHIDGKGRVIDNVFVERL